jgi:hypothetical protein
MILDKSMIIFIVTGNNNINNNNNIRHITAVPFLREIISRAELPVPHADGQSERYRRAGRSGSVPLLEARFIPTPEADACCCMFRLAH